MQMQDTRVIQHHAGLDVHAQRFEVMFHDGSAVGLHPVCAAGEPQMFLRATHYEGLRWVVFDVRHLCPEIEADVLRLHQRDTPGVVFYHLRGKYPTARAFADAALKQRVAAWWQHDAEVAA